MKFFSTPEYSYLNTFPKVASFISLIFLLGSLWYEGLHYNFFGINIFSYISISDAINLFIDKLPLMVLISCGVIVFFLIFQSAFETTLKRLLHFSKYNKRLRMVKFWQVQWILFSISIIPMLAFMVFIPTLLSGSFKTEWFLILRAFIFLFNIFWVFNITNSFSKNKYDDKYFSQKAILITLIITFFIVIYYYHRLEILKISESKTDWRKASYTIKMRNNEIVNCADTINYLGKTKEYIFLLYPKRNYEISSIRVINMNDVQEVKLNRVIAWYSVFP